MTDKNSVADLATNSVSHVEIWLKNNTDLFVTYGINILSALAILFIGNFIAKKIAASVGKVLLKKRMDTSVIEFIHSLVRYLLLIIVLIAALSKVGVQTASVVAVIGAAGLAVGLALQGSLSNFAAGVLLVTFRPFKAGDYVELGHVAGSVDSIQIFQTILKTPDNKMVVVPNGSVIGSPITNYSRHATRRVDHVIGVSYNADLKKTKEIILGVLEANEHVLKTPAPVVGVLALADSSINFVVRPWCNTADYWTVHFDTLEAIKEALDKEGISIPFPQMDVHINKID